MPSTYPDDTRAMLHAEITEVVRAEIGLNEHFASSFADAIMRGLCARIGGREVYIPAIDQSARNAEIKRMFTGGNLDAVCRRYGVSKATVYRIVNRNT